MLPLPVIVRIGFRPIRVDDDPLLLIDASTFEPRRMPLSGSLMLVSVTRDLLTMIGVRTRMRAMRDAVMVMPVAMIA